MVLGELVCWRGGRWRVLEWGVFHHIDDRGVAAALTAFRDLLEPGGICLAAEASWPLRRRDFIGWLGRWMDAGDFVRSNDEWQRLLEQHARIDLFMPYHDMRLPSLLCALSFPD